MSILIPHEEYIEVNIANLSSQELRVKIPGMCSPNERSEQLKISLCTWEHDHSPLQKRSLFWFETHKASAESKESDPCVKPLCAKPSLVAQWCANAGDTVQSLVWEDPTCQKEQLGLCTTTACALEPRSPNGRKEGPSHSNWRKALEPAKTLHSQR